MTSAERAAITDAVALIDALSRAIIHARADAATRRELFQAALDRIAAQHRELAWRDEQIFLLREEIRQRGDQWVSTDG